MTHLICIVAPFSPERLKNAETQAEKTGLDFTLLHGANGDELDLNDYQRAGVGLTLSPRVIACYLSHMSALGLYLEERYDRCVIAEDDFLLTRPNLEEVLDSVPPGDFVTLHNLDYSGAPLKVIETGEGWERLMPPPIINLAYAPSWRFAAAAMKTMFPIQGHVDHYFRQVCINHNFECYRPIPAAVTGSGLPSTLGHE